jgi:predicted DNA-binding transcriptional regulator YafY
MNRIDRLFAITVVLQTRKRVRAADLAALFEVSERTIYRDMQALNESGIPVVSLPGEGYELVEGFYLPTIQLATDEAMALFLGAEMLKSQTSGKLLGSTERARAKVIHALPEAVTESANQFLDILQFSTLPGRLNLDDPNLLLFQRAIRERRVVWIRYHGYYQDKLTEREIEPETLQYDDGVWYVNGYCRLRGGPRSFRLTRIEAARLQSETYLPRIMFAASSKSIEILVRFAPTVIRWVRERQHYSFVQEEPDSSGEGVLMTYRVREWRELKSWLLRWGGGAELLEPAELRQELRAELERLLEQYS